MQGVPGPPCVSCLRAMRPPGLRRVRPQPAAVPHLQGAHPQLCAHIPVLGQVSTSCRPICELSPSLLLVQRSCPAVTKG